MNASQTFVHRCRNCFIIELRNIFRNFVFTLCCCCRRQSRLRDQRRVAPSFWEEGAAFRVATRRKENPWASMDSLPVINEICLPEGGSWRNANPCSVIPGLLLQSIRYRVVAPQSNRHEMLLFLRGLNWFQKYQSKKYLFVCDCSLDADADGWFCVLSAAAVGSCEKHQLFPLNNLSLITWINLSDLIKLVCERNAFHLSSWRQIDKAWTGFGIQGALWSKEATDFLKRVNRFIRNH